MLAIVVCVVMSAAAQEQGDPTQKLIQRIVKSAKGDADAAARLLAAAKSLQDDPKVQVAICEAAYEYGIKAAGGFGFALEALNILDKVAADRAAIWADKRIVVYRLRYMRAAHQDKRQHGQPLVEMLLKTGDDKRKKHKGKEAVEYYREALAVAKRLNLPGQAEISGKLVAAVHLMQLQSTMDRLKAKLAANPGDKASRNSLIEMCVIALDSPAEAAKYLSNDCDEYLRRHVSLAAKPLEELKEAECLGLARWYEPLIDKGTTPTSKANPAGRAVRYYLQFLSLHKTKDAMGVGARLALQSLQERIKKLGLKLPGAHGPLQGSPPEHLLTTKLGPTAGLPAISGWGTGATPWVYSNAASTPTVVMKNAITIPPRSVALHPSPTHDAAVGWRNPSAGRISVRAKVTDAHPSAGNGVEWSIVLRDAKSRHKVLAGGTVDRGGSQTIPTPADAAKPPGPPGGLAAVTVVPGEVISLVVGPRGSHAADSTSIELTITEAGGIGRTWNLARDVASNMQAGNPHADSFGNKKVWYFYAPPHPPAMPKRDEDYEKRREEAARMAAQRRKIYEELRKKHDKNGDGKLDAAERKAYYEEYRERAKIIQWDKDGDGRLSDAERREMEEKQAEAKKRAQEYRRKRMLQQWDKDKDGRMSKKETAAMEAHQGEMKKRAERYRRMQEELRKKHDKDGDGKFSTAERKAYYKEYRQRAKIMQWDKNGDGRLSSAERREMEKAQAESKKRAEKNRRNR